MKKVALISLLAVLLMSYKEPASLQWHSLKEGLDLARAENKPILMFVYVSWCDKCQRMDKKVFTDKSVIPVISENFIAVNLNPEKDTAYLHNDNLIDRKLMMVEISKGKYGIMVPRTVLYNEKNKESKILAGLLDPEELRDSILAFLKK